jgi:hypothetical protein
VAGSPSVAAKPPAAASARLSGPGETSTDGVLWRPAPAGHVLAPGERLRAAEAGTVGLEASGARFVLGPGGRLRADGDLVLEEGRLELAGRDASLLAAGSTLEGSGIAVVRAASGAAAVSVLEGAFTLRSPGGALALSAREGALVRPGSAVEGPLALLDPPRDVVPGSDPVYARMDRPLPLSWTGAGGPYRVTIETRFGGEVVREFAADAPPVSVTLDRPGLYRWRVARVDLRGLEPLSSSDGEICVVPR